jgi:mannitol-1-phosphate 5-dehydrogenase
MVYEAMRSGNFGRYVVAEVDQELVDAVRANGDRVSINIARRASTVAQTLEGLELENPLVSSDRERLEQAVFAADEMATALPSVKFYTTGGAASVAALVAENLNPDKPQILYASENNNYAAELLAEEVERRASKGGAHRLRVLNTVIGKMSGVVRDPVLIEKLGLVPLTPSLPRAVLVEEFNRIYVSELGLPGVRRGIEVFEEKPDLLPFEEAKLFGHNAVHSLLGYLAYERGYETMSAIRNDSELLAFGREAFLDESGAALIAAHGSLGDPLFSPAGFAAYADDLLERMTNPYLYDAVDRICRDPERKLGYDDRLFGAMRACLARGIEPKRLARGALAGLRYMASEGATLVRPLDADDIRRRLAALWQGERDDGLMGRCLELVVSAQKPA